jgi:pyrroline-5-carboxylate reductase
MGQRIAFIGAGNMGTALLRGVLDAGLATARDVMASHPKLDKRNRLAKEIQVQWTESNVEAARFGDVLILAVKPQILDNVLQEIRRAVTPKKLVLSIAAGVTTGRIEKHLPKGTPVIRAMPNVATVVKLGATAVSRGHAARDAHVAAARRVFESVGLVVELPEYLMDAVTGLSGTGPMYVFQIIEGLSDAGVRVGLSRDVSAALTIQTVLGAAKMAQELKQHPGVLKDLVTSPGGTAIAALHSLERNGLRAVLMDAVEAATNRSQELGRVAAQAKPTTTSR